MLPGEDLIKEGLHDPVEGGETVAFLLVEIGAPRLRCAGIAVPVSISKPPEHRLYRRLAADNSDSAHSRYDALIRRLVSYERALYAWASPTTKKDART